MKRTTAKRSTPKSRPAPKVTRTAAPAKVHHPAMKTAGVVNRDPLGLQPPPRDWTYG